MAPILMLTVGISGSGKSKFTNFIKASLGAQEVNADNIRAQLGDVSDQSKNQKTLPHQDRLSQCRTDQASLHRSAHTDPPDTLHAAGYR